MVKTSTKVEFNKQFYSANSAKCPIIVILHPIHSPKIYPLTNPITEII